MTPRTITVGIDGSPASSEALGWAAREARLRHAALCIIHAYRPPARFPAVSATDRLVAEADARAQQVLDDALRTVRPQLSADTWLVSGPAAPALVNQSSDSDLLVVGSRGRGGFAGMVLGSVSLHCATHAHCPVAIVRPAEADVENRIVVGVDGSPDSRAALRWAVDEARLRDAPLEAVMAWQRPWPGPRPKIDLVSRLAKTRAVEALAAALGAVVGDATGVKRTVVEDRPALALVEASKGAALLVVGARGLGGFAGLAFGSVSQACAHHAPSPLVIVR